MRRFLALVAAVLVCAPGVLADETIECEHAKVNTEDATPVDVGAWELELSLARTWAKRQFTGHWGSAARPRVETVELGLGLTYGLAPDLDVGVGLSYLGAHERGTSPAALHGFGDLEVGLKWRFYRDEAAGLEVAYVPSLSLPTGEDGVSDEFYNFYNAIAVSKDWGGPWTSNFELGYNLPFGGDRGGYRGTLCANAALGCQVSELLQPEVELNYAHEFWRGADADMVAATLGCIICLTDHLRLDLGVQRVLAGRNVDRETAVQGALVCSF